MSYRKLSCKSVPGSSRPQEKDKVLLEETTVVTKMRRVSPSQHLNSKSHRSSFITEEHKTNSDACTEMKTVIPELLEGTNDSLTSRNDIKSTKYSPTSLEKLLESSEQNTEITISEMSHNTKKNKVVVQFIEHLDEDNKAIDKNLKLPETVNVTNDKTTDITPPSNTCNMRPKLRPLGPKSKSTKKESDVSVTSEKPHLNLQSEINVPIQQDSQNLSLSASSDPSNQNKSDDLTPVSQNPVPGAVIYTLLKHDSKELESRKRRHEVASAIQDNITNSIIHEKEELKSKIAKQKLYAEPKAKQTTEIVNSPGTTRVITKRTDTNSSAMCKQTDDNFTSISKTTAEHSSSMFKSGQASCSTPEKTGDNLSSMPQKTDEISSSKSETTDDNSNSMTIKLAPNSKSLSTNNNEMSIIGTVTKKTGTASILRVCIGPDKMHLLQELMANCTVAPTTFSAAKPASTPWTEEETDKFLWALGTLIPRIKAYFKNKSINDVLYKLKDELRECGSRVDKAFRAAAKSIASSTLEGKAGESQQHNITNQDQKQPVKVFSEPTAQTSDSNSSKYVRRGPRTKQTPSYVTTFSPEGPQVVQLTNKPKPPHILDPGLKTLTVITSCPKSTTDQRIAQSYFGSEGNVNAIVLPDILVRQIVNFLINTKITSPTEQQQPQVALPLKMAVPVEEVVPLEQVFPLPSVLPFQVATPLQEVAPMAVAAPVEAAAVQVAASVEISAAKIAAPVGVAAAQVTAPAEVAPIEVHTPVQVMTIQVASPAKVAAVKPAAPVEVTSVKVAAPVEDAAIEVAAPGEVAAADIAAPVQVTAAKIAAPVEVATVEVATPKKVVPIQLERTPIKKVVDSEKSPIKRSKRQRYPIRGRDYSVQRSHKQIKVVNE